MKRFSGNAHQRRVKRRAYDRKMELLRRITKAMQPAVFAAATAKYPAYEELFK